MRRICPNCRTMTFDDVAQTCRNCGRALELLTPRNSQRIPRFAADAPAVDFGRSAAQPAATPAVIVSDESGGEHSEPSDLPPVTDRPLPAEPWRQRLWAEAKANTLLFVAIVAAGLGWGVAAGALSARPQKSAAPRPVSTAAAPAELAEQLQERDRELTALTQQYRSARADVDAGRRTANERAAAQALAASTALAAAHDEVAEESRTLAAVRAQLVGAQSENASLRSDNAGLEKNYNDLLDALHRTQNQVYGDEKRIAADVKQIEAARTSALAAKAAARTAALRCRTRR